MNRMTLNACCLLIIIIQGDEVERQVSVRKRLQFQQQQPVDDESTAVLRNRGAQTRVSWSHDVIYANRSLMYRPNSNNNPNRIASIYLSIYCCYFYYY